MELSEFAQKAQTTTWFEDEQTGFHMDVDAALASETEAFRWSPEPADMSSLVFEIEWIGEGTTLSDVDRDFFRVYGRFAEEAQYVRRAIETKAVVYYVTLGDENHGHRAAFRLIGMHVAQVLAGMA